MPKHGALLVVTILATLVGPVAAQPGAAEPAPSPSPPPDPGPAPTGQPAQPEPQPPQPPQPTANATQATFVSTSSEPWEVLLDRQPACATPCSIYVEPMRFVTLRSIERSPVRLDVGYLPPGSVMVRGKPLQNGKYAGGIVATTFAGMGLVTGVTLAAVGFGTDRRGMRTAGLITGGVSAIGLYLGIQLMRSAVPTVQVLPAQPYVAGNTVGFVRAF